MVSDIDRDPEKFLWKRFFQEALLDHFRASSRDHELDEFVRCFWKRYTEKEALWCEGCTEKSTKERLEALEQRVRGLEERG